MEARTFQALATRNPNGDKQLLIVGGGVTGYWAQEPMGISPSPRVWAPGELGVVVMSAQGWHGYFGGFKAVYGDDMALAHDVALTARYLSDHRPVDFREPATADLQALSDGLGLRLPTAAAEDGPCRILLDLSDAGRVHAGTTWSPRNRGRATFRRKTTRRSRLTNCRTVDKSLSSPAARSSL